jgi:dTDP-4-dehydrorhamnose reductase
LNICITGASGNLGSQLKKLFPEANTPTHETLDITNGKLTLNYIRKGQIDTIIHCAALTNVRYCEENREETHKVNVNGTLNLAQALSSSNSKHPYFVYISTACVFPGDSPSKYYSEDDVPYPKNLYALTKLIGEWVVAGFSKSLLTLIVRTNFIGRGKWPYPSAFTDRFATYLYSDQVANEVMNLAKKRMSGLVHVCGDRKMSMYEFARLGDPRVKPMTLQDYSGPSLTINMSLTSRRIPVIPFESSQKIRGA